MYFKVYDKKGEPFEVTAGRLRDLILNRGWTFWPPSEEKSVFKDDQGQVADGEKTDV